MCFTQGFSQLLMITRVTMAFGWAINKLSPNLQGFSCDDQCCSDDSKLKLFKELGVVTSHLPPLFIAELGEFTDSCMAETI